MRWLCNGFGATLHRKPKKLSLVCGISLLLTTWKSSARVFVWIFHFNDTFIELWKRLLFLCVLHVVEFENQVTEFTPPAGTMCAASNLFKAKAKNNSNKLEKIKEALPSTLALCQTKRTQASQHLFCSIVAKIKKQNIPISEQCTMSTANRLSISNGFCLSFSLAWLFSAYALIFFQLNHRLLCSHKTFHQRNSKFSFPTTFSVHNSFQQFLLTIHLCLFSPRYTY